MDYWSNFFEVAEIHRKTTQAVTTQFKVQFAPLPEVLFTDNGPAFDNRDFKIVDNGRLRRLDAYTGDLGRVR